MFVKKEKNQKRLNAKAIGFVVWCLMICFSFRPSLVHGLTLEEKQVGEVSRTLKSALEENQGLQGKAQTLEGEMERLRMENEAIQGRITNLQKERDDLAEDVKKTKTINRNYAKEVKRLEESLQQQTMNQAASHPEEIFEGSMSGDINEFPDVEEYTDLATTTEEVVDREEKTLDLLSRIDAFSEGDDELRMDAAKAHYNMGNIYFNKGEYEIAAREYYQAVALMPDDPDAHYNLAFVSGEYLKDFATALKHYQMYLYLNPNPPDRDVVIEKMTGARLEVEGTVDSVLDNK